MEKYKILDKKGEGTFSDVARCIVIDQSHPLCGSYCAVKRMKKSYPSWDYVNSVREVQALKRLNPHPNILTLVEVVYSERLKTLDLVCELMDLNLYEVIRDRKVPLPESQVKQYMFQLCKGMDHMHKNGIFHRDIKPENILVNADHVLKIADLGSCRGVYSKPPFTEYISTRWYRAPECLLTDGHYGYKMDIWSVGCVFYEIASLRPLFPGRNELDQLAQIHAVLGTPPVATLNKIRKFSMHMKFSFQETPGNGLLSTIPHAGDQNVNLLRDMLAYDPDERCTARSALQHEYFADIRGSDRHLSQETNSSSVSGADETKISPTDRKTEHPQQQKSQLKMPPIHRKPSNANSHEDTTSHMTSAQPAGHGGDDVAAAPARRSTNAPAGVPDGLRAGDVSSTEIVAKLAVERTVSPSTSTPMDLARAIQQPVVIVRSKNTSQEPSAGSAAATMQNVNSIPKRTKSKKKVKSSGYGQTNASSDTNQAVKYFDIQQTDAATRKTHLPGISHPNGNSHKTAGMLLTKSTRKSKYHPTSHASRLGKGTNQFSRPPGILRAQQQRGLDHPYNHTTRLYGGNGGHGVGTQSSLGPPSQTYRSLKGPSTKASQAHRVQRNVPKQQHSTHNPTGSSNTSVLPPIMLTQLPLEKSVPRAPAPRQRNGARAPELLSTTQRRQQYAKQLRKK
eukprot:m.62851 g.62851  ORF g.62851 m.62851 type:complete len:678 (+) comp15815_c0_seq6:491-2524(+)